MTATDADPRPLPDALALLLLIPAPSIGVAAAMWLLKGTTGDALFAIAKVWMIALPAVWHLAVDRRRPTWSPPHAGGFRLALGLGIAIASAIVGGWLLFGPSLVDPEPARRLAAETGLDRAPRYLALSAYWITINSLLEEYVYRWFIFRKWETFLPTRAAAVASALCFTLHHVIALRLQFDWTTTIVASSGVFVGGLTWSLLYARYRSIWPCWLSHACADVAVFWVGWQVIHGG